MWLETENSVFWGGLKTEFCPQKFELNRVWAQTRFNSIQLDSNSINPSNVDTTTLKRSPTHKNQRDLTCGPYHRYVPTCSFNNSVLTIDHGQNVVKQESLSRHEEVANNNASNHGFYCLRQDYGQVSQHKPYRRMFHCSKRSLQPYLSFSTSLLFSVTANPSRTKHKYNR